MTIRVFLIAITLFKLLIPFRLFSQLTMNSDLSKNDFPANSKTKENYVLVFDNDFEELTLNTQNWIPYYLPQWSSREKSKPNYKIKNGQLFLQITDNQQPWCPEFNGEVKCSSIQTGVFAGELGSKIGQHEFFNPTCVVREEQKKEHTFLPKYGYIEIRAKALATKSNVVSLWMIGYEDQPERSAELCVFEVKGWNVKENKAKIGFGIHKFNDPKLKEEFYEEDFELDATKFHVYAAEWADDKVDFFIDNQLIKTIHQSPDYPMQLMLGIYEVPVNQKDKLDLKYPKDFIIDYVRGYSFKK
jgi:Glycosyl hydrolases family 16